MYGMNYFVARSTQYGVTKSYRFDKSRFNQAEAEKWLSAHDIKNVLFIFEPNEPLPFGENGLIFSGEIGFDITINNLIPAIELGKEVIIDSFGGGLYDGLKIYDAIKLLGTNPSIGVMGMCASAATLPLMATENRWASENSLFMIHNPWSITAGDDEELRKEADELEMGKVNLARIYSTATKIEIESILALMKEGKFITVSEAFGMGFIKTIKTNVKKEDMTEKQNQEVDGLITRFKALFSPKIKNMEKVDVNGETLTIEREEGDPQVGDIAAPDGTFTFEDGSSIVVENGAISSITEPATEDVEALKARIAELEAANAELTSKAQAATKAESEFLAKQNEADAILAKLRAIQSKTVIAEKQNNFKQNEKPFRGLDKERYAETTKKLEDKKNGNK